MTAGVFLLFTVAAVAAMPQVTATLVGWMPYPVLALRRVFGQGVRKTAVKYLALGWSYFVVLASGAVTTLVVALHLL